LSIYTHIVFTTLKAGENDALTYSERKDVTAVLGGLLTRKLTAQNEGFATPEQLIFQEYSSVRAGEEVTF
jgi:hypothetical protein